MEIRAIHLELEHLSGMFMTKMEMKPLQIYIIPLMIHVKHVGVVLMVLNLELH